MIGEKFGRAEVIDIVEDYIAPSGGKHKRYLCQCDCGVQFFALKEHLTSGRTKSCGCLRKENGIVTHAQTGTRLYRIWGNMVNRCSNPNNPVYERYGDRGITVCEEWKSFEPFMLWAVNNGYSDSLSLDRIDNDGGYNPGNCRWTTDFVQGNNKRNNNRVEYNGVTHTIAEWASILGIPYKTLHRRIVSLKWDIHTAFTKPLRKSSC